MVLCPACKGHPMVPVFVKRTKGAGPMTEEQAKKLSEMMKCQLCNGTNEVTEEVAARWDRGRAFAAKRLEAGYGMRHYAEAVGILPSDLCDMENGRAEPPEFVDPKQLGGTSGEA